MTCNVMSILNVVIVIHKQNEKLNCMITELETHEHQTTLIPWHIIFNHIGRNYFLNRLLKLLLYGRQD